MIFNSRRAFTITELIIATLLFGFMMASMVGIYSAANKNMFQNYRQNAVKTGALIAIKSITFKLQEANRIDSPVVNGTSNVLAFAVNVDQRSACYPINISLPVTWHYYCRAPAITAACPYGNCLYYHTGGIGAGAGASCPNTIWNPVNYPVVCGQAGGTITQLASHVQPNGSIFSRDSADVPGGLAVKVRLRVLWDPANAGPGRNFSSSGRIIDTTFATTVRLNMPAP